MTESAGVRLKKIRREKGLSLEEVHKKTKLSLGVLKAIEEDSFVGFNPVYLKGFLKIYCKLLGVEPKDFIADYQVPETQARLLSESQPQEKTDSFLKDTIVKLDSFRKINSKTIFLVLSILLFLIGLFYLGKFMASRRVSKTREAKSPLFITERMPKKKIQSLATKKLVVPAVTSRQQPRQVTPPKSKDIVSIIRLGMRAKEDCWVHLKIDGRVVFHGILKKGKFESWQAKEKIEFSLGNAWAVELELNSKPIPVLGRRGQALKNIVITREEGLIVPR
jgi:transcriptional regulator with XRE-family HTH domain